MSEGSTRGKRRSRAQWQQLIAACHASGHSQAGFCRQRGLALSTLQYWKRRLPVDLQASVSAQVIDLGELRPAQEAQPPAASCGWVFELLLGDWLRLSLRRV